MFPMKSIAIVSAGLLLGFASNHASAELRQPLSIDESQLTTLSGRYPMAQLKSTYAPVIVLRWTAAVVSAVALPWIRPVA